MLAGIEDPPADVAPAILVALTVHVENPDVHN